MSDPSKLKLTLVEGEFVEAMARVMDHGNQKKGRRPGDWKNVPLEVARDEFRNALLRHELEDRKDPGHVDISGQMSLVSMATNAMMLWWHERNRNG